MALRLPRGTRTFGIISGMKLFVATHNQHKIREISQILPDFEIVPDDPAGAEETAPDFIGNAFIKVRAISAKHPGEWCMADDSGLEVRALGGAPGVRSARYAGEPSNTQNNNALLLKNLAGAEDRTANFTCAIALVDPNGVEHEAIGKCFGHIALEPSGTEGFGYDPLFVPDGHDKSFADLSAGEKNAISHRGRALEKAKAIIGGGRAVDGGRAGRAERAGGGRGSRTLAWLRLFRVVNLPTVPGDVFVGASVVTAGVCRSGVCSTAVSPGLAPVWWAAAASVFLYAFGMVDNDIAGAKTDRNRPIPDGEISLGAARIARASCIFAAIGIGCFASLPHLWWVFALSIAATAVVYNRFKWCLAIGLCRALNVVCGGASIVAGGLRGIPGDARLLVFCAFLSWLLYIAAVTLYSTGEENDPAKKRRVGLLVGGIVYLQLLALILCAVADARTMPFMVAGGVLLVLLRVFRRIFPKVSAS